MNMIGSAGFSNMLSIACRFSRFRIPLTRIPTPPPAYRQPRPKQRPQEPIEEFRARRRLFVRDAEIRRVIADRWKQFTGTIAVDNAKLDAVPKDRRMRAGEFIEAYGSRIVAQGKRRRDGFDQEAYEYGVDDSRPALVKRCCLPVSQQRDFLTDVSNVFSWDEAERVEHEGKRIVKEVMEYGWWMDRERDTAINGLTTRLRLLRLDGSIPQPLIPPFFPAHRDTSPAYPTPLSASLLPAVINAPSSIGSNKTSMNKTRCFRARPVVSKESFLQFRRYRRRRLDDQLKLRGYLNNRRSPLKVLERRRRRRHMVKHVMIKDDSASARVFSCDDLQSALLELVDETVLGTDVITEDITELQDMVVDESDDYNLDSGDTTLVQKEDICSLDPSPVSSPASSKKREIVGTVPEVTAHLPDSDGDFKIEAGVVSEASLSVSNNVLGHEANNILTGPSSSSDGYGLEVNHSVLEPVNLPSSLHSHDTARDLMALDINTGDLGTEASSSVVGNSDNVTTASHTPTIFGAVQGMVAALSDVSYLCATDASSSSKGISKSKAFKHRRGKVEDVISDITSHRGVSNQGHSVSSSGIRKRGKRRKRLEQLQEAIVKEKEEEHLSTFDAERHEAQFKGKQGVRRVPFRIKLMNGQVKTGEARVLPKGDDPEADT